MSIASGTTLVNDGTIRGGQGGAGFSNPSLSLLTAGPAGASAPGVTAGANGTVSNAAATASIQGTVGVQASGAGVLVSNLGTISGTVGAGVVLAMGGTVTDVGLIFGGNGTAVSFGGSGGNRLVLSPGAQLTGAATASGTSNVLELASSTSVGTVTAVGIGIIGFQSITVDAGAAWSLSGPNTVAAGTTLSDAGTLALAGSLNNAGLIGATGNAIVDGGAPETLTNIGTISAGAGAVGAVNSTGSPGSAGGSAVSLSSGGGFNNAGTLFGGTGGAGGGHANGDQGFAGGAGGTALSLAGAFSATNQGLILGGTGGVGRGASSPGGGGAGGVGATVAGSFTNNGSIAGGAGGAGGAGLYFGAPGGAGGSGLVLASGGTLINTGQIAGGGGGNGSSGGAGGGGGYGVSLAGAGSVTNTGSIAGGTGGAGSSAGTGVFLTAGDAITNGTSAGSTASISGGVGISAAGGSVTVTNYGHIVGAGGAGVSLGGGGTVFDAGVITGGAGTAIAFGGGGGSRLILAPGYAINGAVSGADNLLELISAATTGTLGGLAASIGAFNAILVDGGATWSLIGNDTIGSGTSLINTGSLVVSSATLVDNGVLDNNGGMSIDPASVTIASLIGLGGVTIGAGGLLESGGTIGSAETIAFNGPGAYLRLDQPGGVAGQVTNFDVGETIALVGVNIASVSVDGGDLDFTGGGFRLGVSRGNLMFTQTQLGTDVSAVACFVRGTGILTPSGHVPVEWLKPGDPVVTDLGTRPVKWIGRRRIDPRRHPDPWRATPIRFRAGAIADGVPARGVLLSPDHAVMLHEFSDPRPATG